MVAIVLGRTGLPAISHAGAVKYQGFVNATHPLLLLVDVTVLEHQLSLAAVTTIRANVRIPYIILHVFTIYYCTADLKNEK